MLIIDLPADLDVRDVFGRSIARRPRGMLVEVADVFVARRLDAWSWVVVGEVEPEILLHRRISADEAAERAELVAWPTLAGSRVPVTDVDEALRSWLVLVAHGRQSPTVLLIDDEPIAPTGSRDRAAAQQALRERAQSLFVMMSGHATTDSSRFSSGTETGTFGFITC